MPVMTHDGTRERVVAADPAGRNGNIAVPQPREHFNFFRTGDHPQY